MAMNSTQLRKWCEAKYGRASALAKGIGTSREFIRQMSLGKRPIPQHFIKAMKRLMEQDDAQPK